jgi:hypothetical protein
MLSLTKQVFAKYWPLIVKMHENKSKNNVTLKNLIFLCDVELILKLLHIRQMEFNLIEEMTFRVFNFILFLQMVFIEVSI